MSAFSKRDAGRDGVHAPGCLSDPEWEAGDADRRRTIADGLGSDARRAAAFRIPSADRALVAFGLGLVAVPALVARTLWIPYGAVPALAGALGAALGWVVATLLLGLLHEVAFRGIPGILAAWVLWTIPILRLWYGDDPLSTPAEHLLYAAGLGLVGVLVVGGWSRAVLRAVRPLRRESGRR